MVEKAKVKRSSLITPEATALFVYVFEPRESMNEGAPAQYQMSLLFKKSQDITALRTAVRKLAREKFGERAGKLRDPFRSVDEMESPIQGFRGGVFITAKSKSRPGIVAADLSPITDAMDFYPGCICRASVVPYAYDKKGQKGVSFLLNNVQKLRDGDRLDGKKRAEDEFDVVSDNDDDDPLG